MSLGNIVLTKEFILLVASETAAIFSTGVYGQMYARHKGIRIFAGALYGGYAYTIGDLFTLSSDKLTIIRARNIMCNFVYGIMIGGMAAYLTLG